jgi:hypothetical protein
MMAAVGCSTFGKQAPNDTASGGFEKARLSYRVDTDRLNGRKSQAEGTLVSYNGAPSNKLPANSKASLEIRSPHPDKREGLAQVRVRIESQGESSGVAWLAWWRSAKEELPGLKGAGWTQETWVLDIPQSELRGILGSLRGAGYFYTFAPPHDATLLETELDGTRLTKKWTQVRELDALIYRARTEGRLVSSTKAPSGASGEVGPSVAAYRDALAQEGAAVASDMEPAPNQTHSPTAVPVGHIAPVQTAPGGVQMVRLPPVESAPTRRF